MNVQTQIYNNNNNNNLEEDTSDMYNRTLHLTKILT
jgi:hypothetical protein